MDQLPPFSEHAGASPPVRAPKKKERSRIDIAGYSFLAGDAALYAAGHLSGRKEEAAAGAVWALGGLACARYGNPKADQKLAMVTRRLNEFLEQQEVTIPESPATAMLAKRGGVLEKMEDFMFRYPTESLNAVYSVGGALMARGGMRSGNPYDAASGVLIAAGGLAGLLIPERKPDGEHPPETPLGKAAEWVQEKPLRLTGGLYMLNNATMALAARRDMHLNPGSKAYLFKYLTAATYIFGNAMLATSSKGQGGSALDADDPQTASLLKASAAVISAQPEPVRETLMHAIASHLSAQPEIDLKASEINTMLQAQLSPQRGRGL